MKKELLVAEGRGSSETNLLARFGVKIPGGDFGYFIRLHDKLVVARIYNNGLLVARYNYPKMGIPFKSKMHQWYNVGFNCRSSLMENKRTGDNLRAVIDGRKPMGFITVTDQDKADFLELIQQTDLEYRETKVENGAVIGFAVSGTFGKHFNLEALIRSYERLEAAHYGVLKGYIMNEYVKRRVHALCNQKLSDYLVGYDFADPKSDYDLILTGLLFGHPVQSTFAFLVGSMDYNNLS